MFFSSSGGDKKLIMVVTVCNLIGDNEPLMGRLIKFSAGCGNCTSAAIFESSREICSLYEMHPAWKIAASGRLRHTNYSKALTVGFSVSHFLAPR